LKRLTEELEQISTKEPNVDIEFNVAWWEYGIDWFWKIKRVNYSVKEPADYKDIPHYYEIECDTHC
jgi:hypothetical protein